MSGLDDLIHSFIVRIYLRHRHDVVIFNMSKLCGFFGFFVMFFGYGRDGGEKECYYRKLSFIIVRKIVRRKDAKKELGCGADYSMDKILTKKEAIKFLSLDDKTFDNYFQNADEFKCLERQNNRGRYLFDQKVLQKWLDDFKWRTVELNFKDERNLGPGLEI